MIPIIITVIIMIIGLPDTVMIYARQIMNFIAFIHRTINPSFIQKILMQEWPSIIIQKQFTWVMATVEDVTRA